jgi:hypothetical protein
LFPPRQTHAAPSRAVHSGVHEVLRSAGRPLSTTDRSHFEGSFQHDFSSVRVHAGDGPAASAASLSARAYTVGRDIVFGRGQYAPATENGRRLLGHELAHVVQQSRGGSATPGTPGLDAEADRAASRAARNMPAPVAGSSAVGVARKTVFEEFTGGKYMWSLLKQALEHTRPVPTIIEDIKGLTRDQQAQAMSDMALERVSRGRTQAFRTGQQSTQTDPKLHDVFDPVLAEGKRVIDRIDAVLDGLGPANMRKPIPGWNFTPEDFAKLQGAKKQFTIASDSTWFPAKMQENLLNTLAFVLGSSTSPSATEGVNAVDFFHGHLVIKKDPATDTQSKGALASANRFDKDLAKAGDVAHGKMSFDKRTTMTDKQIGAYGKALEKIEPSLANLMQTAMAVPGSAVMYHTFESTSPLEMRAKGQKRDSEDPRRHYVTPLDSNSPRQYTPPAGGTYEREFTHIVRFSFLIDATGAVHVRPMDTHTGLTTLELSTITGANIPDPIDFDK